MGRTYFRHSPSQTAEFNSEIFPVKFPRSLPVLGSPNVGSWWCLHSRRVTAPGEADLYHRVVGFRAHMGLILVPAKRKRGKLGISAYWLCS